MWEKLKAIADLAFEIPRWDKAVAALAEDCMLGVGARIDCEFICSILILNNVIQLRTRHA